MNNALVKYGNQMNAVPFKKFNKRDLNIFFSIVSRMRDKGDRSVSFTFDQLRDIAGIDYHGHNNLFLKDLKATYRKMQNLTLFYSDKDKFISWVLFTRFEIDKKHHNCTVKVNPDLSGILNNIAKQFTRFSLAEFNRLDSTYAKNMFRLIKQYRTTGHVYMKIDKFKRLLMVPKSYNGGAISRRVITPILVELCPIIPGLHVERKYGAYHKIVAYNFLFDPEKRRQNDFQKNDSNLHNEARMVRLAKGNPYLSYSIRKRAVSKIVNKPNFQSKVKMPMDEFNGRLKTSNLHNLKQWLELRNHHMRYLTEYQTRKLKKCIKNKEASKKKDDEIVNERNEDRKRKLGDE